MTSRGSLAGRLHRADWFPVDLDVRTGAFHMLTVDDSAVRSAPFLDNRFDVDWGAAEQLAVRDVPAAASQGAAWLWHTSFCGSTLLARMLDVPPVAIALKEPLVLRRLSDAAHAGIETGPLLQAAVALLSRPWQAGGIPLIKPTHAALNIGLRTMGVAGGDRAVLVTSDLDDFLISNLKKTEATRVKAATLAERALGSGTFLSRLPAQALSPPDHLCAASLQWAAQRELALDMIGAAEGRMRPVDAALLMADPLETAWACVQWLALPIERHALVARYGETAGAHAKATSRPYSNAIRQAEKRAVAARFAPALRSAQDWAARWVLPAMRGEAITMAGAP